MLENMGKRLTIPHQKKKLMRKYYGIMFSNFFKGHLVCIFTYRKKSAKIHKYNCRLASWRIFKGFYFLSFLTHNS